VSYDPPLCQHLPSWPELDWADDIGYLLVDDIQEIHWNKSAFDRLVLDPDKKSLITAMVKEHVLSDVSADVIEGKGNGLIILLHGGPGTGKTLTAESVAELAEKPLYRVTCGDIGTDAEAVEKYLESVLYIGTIWKAGEQCLMHFELRRIANFSS